jgi:hypothetical protein
MLAAIEDALIGGNHLANFLIGKLGGDFASRFPPTMPSGEVLEALPNDVYDVWCCWAALMRLRDAS